MEECVFQGVVVPFCVHRSVLACNKTDVSQARPKQRNELSTTGGAIVAISQPGLMECLALNRHSANAGHLAEGCGGGSYNFI